MDVNEVVTSEFKSVFSRHNFNVTYDYLAIARSPFNLAAVQKAVDEDITRTVSQSRAQTFTERIVVKQRREQYHKEALKKLARQYALQILKYARQGQSINESMVLNEQRSLKAEAGVGCDAYPCGNQFRVR